MFKTRSLIASAALFISSLANASPISYEFTTSWYEGELTGVISKGYFAYDSARAEPGKIVETLDLFTDFEFSLRTFRYTEATVNSARASFDEKGVLRSIVFGTDCYFTPLGDGGKVGGCAAWSDRLDKFFIQYNADHPLYAAAAGDNTYPDPDKYPWFSSGRTTVRLVENGEFPHQVPEPSVSFMLLSGLGLMAATCLRRKYPRVARR